MVHQGIVRKVLVDGWAEVVPLAPSGCGHCGAAADCPGAAGAVGQRSVRARNLIGATAGDRVRIAYGTRSLWSAAMLYLFPTGGLILGAMIGQALGPRWGLDGNSGSILVGMGALPLCFLVGLACSRRLADARGHEPIIFNLVDWEEAGGLCRAGAPASRTAGASEQALEAATFAALRSALGHRRQSD